MEFENIKTASKIFNFEESIDKIILSKTLTVFVPSKQTIKPKVKYQKALPLIHCLHEVIKRKMHWL